MPKPPPKCKAILFCDHAKKDPATGKVDIQGVLDYFEFQQFPAMISPFTMYLQLIDGIGSYLIAVEVHDLQNDSIIATTDGILAAFSKKGRPLRLIVNIPPLRVAHAGAYDFIALADGQEIDRQKLDVRQSAL